jgi:hypothetical protein
MLASTPPLLQRDVRRLLYLLGWTTLLSPFRLPQHSPATLERRLARTTARHREQGLLHDYENEDGRHNNGENATARMQQQSRNGGTRM